MPNPDDSILDSVKKLLGIDDSYEVFDQDIIIHINSVFGTLHQLGVGPTTPYTIDDGSSVWSEFIGERTKISAVRSLVYLKVRLLFDPPATSFAIQAIEKVISEYEWRLSVASEETSMTEEGVEVTNAHRG